MGNRVSLLTPHPASQVTPGIRLSKDTARLNKDTAHLSKDTAPRPLPPTTPPAKRQVRLPAKRSAVGLLVQPLAVPSAPLPAAVPHQQHQVRPPSRLTAAFSPPPTGQPPPHPYPPARIPPHTDRA